MDEVLIQYFDNPDYCVVTPITSGLINLTYQINVGVNKYILQEINSSIFPEPEIIIANMLFLDHFLKEKNYPKETLSIIPNNKGLYLTYANGKTWRMTKFITSSISYNKVVSKEQAFNAAKAISEFHYYLNDFDVNRIKPSIKGFLDFKTRVKQFNEALEKGNTTRLIETKEIVEYIKSQSYLIDNYLQINFPQRIVHADAKISNFLFDENNENNVLAIIDWDTILPGNILCDFGDMVRTYANIKEEDDTSDGNLFSAHNFEALKEGFLLHLKEQLTDVELDNINLSAQVVILIQAIRFITDYLLNDTYYTITYEKQNLNRTINQINLLKELNQYLCIN